MKNKSFKLPFMTKNSKHLVRTICSQMKNKSLKLQFVTKNSKHSWERFAPKLPIVTKNSKHLVGASGDDGCLPFAEKIRKFRFEVKW